MLTVLLYTPALFIYVGIVCGIVFRVLSWENERWLNNQDISNNNKEAKAYMERMVKDLLRTTLSRKTLNTGEVKQMTIRSPIGMNGMAARQAKLAVEAVNPYTESKR